MYCNVFGGGGYGFGIMYGGGPNFFMMIPMIVLLLVFVYLMYKVFSNKQLASAYSPPASAKAMSILNERLAKGEITEEEYKSIKEQINR
ncbi:SHOCT domain-containing protein [Clostridium sp. C2-6-12]|uniref:SHOCT domain-containing protein n=1 Tax=Clostridium sp. C2-6-12 TaxID=2698832 RepID=UPI00136D4500|nr:SHOCT domain-containing protein [Clostridium sp. C2-6-12]